MTDQKTMNASDFKARCLAILDQVRQQGLVITILKHGKPVAQVGPVITSLKEIPQKELMGSVTIHEDLLAPVLSEEELKLEKDVM